MVDFKKLDEYIDYIESSKIPSIFSFNEFAIEFYTVSQAVPLSKYLKLNNRQKKLPKVMNMKRVGYVLSETQKNLSYIESYLKTRGYSKIPELNYTCIKFLRKVEVIENWKIILHYFGRGKTITEINNTTKPKLFPDEIKKLKNYIIEDLKINDDQLDILLKLYQKAEKNKNVLKAVKKLNKQY